MDEAQYIDEQSGPQGSAAPMQRVAPRRAVVMGLAGLAVGGLGMIGLGVEALKRLYTYSPALLTYRGHTKGINVVAWSLDSRRIASASDDGTVQVWNASTGKPLLTYGTQASGNSGGFLLGSLIGGVQAMAWSPDGASIASAAGLQPEDNSIPLQAVLLWDANTGGTLMSYSDQKLLVIEGLAWSPDGARLAFTAGYGSPVQILDVATGKIVLTYQGHGENGAKAIAWSPDGTRIVSAGEVDDITVLVWDASTGQTLLSYQGHKRAPTVSGVATLAWSPDSQRIASGGWDRTAQVWDASAGQRIVIYTGHDTGETATVRSVAWSPDGRRIASGGDDATAQVWNASTGEQLFMYTGHSSLVASVAWSPDGSRIASGSGDKTVQVWRPT
jgi:WD40 repeat protein